uniref:Uncharacterized protein n=1 Tax=Anguilla anguilla TaxID=7936 RepID=A0A0E9WVG6_ANGAN
MDILRCTAMVLHRRQKEHRASVSGEFHQYAVTLHLFIHLFVYLSGTLQLTSLQVKSRHQIGYTQGF